MAIGHYFIWLIPSETDSQRLRPIMDDLSLEFGAPRFQPHMTLFSGDLEQISSLATWFDHTLPIMSPITLTVDTLMATDEFFKTLFLTFLPDKRLTAFEQEMKEQIVTSSHYEWIPHLSLLYATIPLREKEALVERLQIGLKTITFDRIDLIRELDLLDVASWKADQSWRMEADDTSR